MAWAGPAGPRPRWLDLLLVLTLGALSSVAYVHTGAWPLQLACVALLVWRLGGLSPGWAGALGLAFGTAWLLASVWWLFISMHRFGGLPAPLAALAVLLLCAALSLYLGLAVWAWARWRSGHAVPDALLFAALWLLAELARGRLLTGFPWAASGYAHVDSPLASLAPWLGVYGMGAVASFSAALLGLALRAHRPRTLVGAVVTLATLWLALLASGPGAFTQTSGRFSVALLQTNVAQDEKFASEHLPAALAWVSQRLREPQVDLVVAPETAVPLLPEQLHEFEPGYWPALQAHFQRPGRAALLGLPLGDFDSGYTNSVLGLSDAAPYRYDKHHLVPFGEFIPTGFHWFVQMMNIPLGDFARGPLVAPSFAVRGQAGQTERVAPNICYEDLFGEELAQRFADPAQAPTAMANLSNIGWFGDTIAIAQHLQISRLRTLELQRPMMRATNTGATVLIDHRGRVTQSLAPFTRGVLVGTVEGRSGLTPYARWVSRLGLWPLLALALAIVMPAAWMRRRRRL